ncbi:50S ribosomal protein L32 [Candidatus Uhrbacteria bacterium]|nr:50S ribosomal protein L32 [Candidatus Uhrbacteria bacterium]
MPVPAHRKSSSRKRRGRAHLALKQKQLTVCVACKAPIAPHHACPSCGHYAGRTVKK